jgi:hypothetical protein
MIAAFMMARFAQTSNSSYPHPAFSLYKHAKNATHDLVSIWIREGFPDNLDKFLLPSSPYRRVCRVVCGCVTFLHRHLRYPVLKRPKSRENRADLPAGQRALFSRLLCSPEQRHNRPMFDPDFFIQFVLELARASFVDAFSERAKKSVRRVRLRVRPRGMKQIRQDVHQKCRKRLLNRISP